MHYDYILAGAGCAGLSLAYRLNQHPELRQKKILVLDKNLKNQNDRTWCFWVQGSTPFDAIAHKTWDNIWFHHAAFSQKFNLAPYRYQMIRGLDFYEFVLNDLSQNPHITIQWGNIANLQSQAQVASLELDNQAITADWIFNSLPPTMPEKRPNFHYYLQHFKGWVVETPQAFFDDSTATFMDFRIPQQSGEARFFYVLPTSPTRALVEFTVFSENLLPEAQYDEELKKYFQTFLQLSDYQIVEQEFGIIPMYDTSFATRHSPRILNIGITGGRAKASTGYTFMNIQKQSDRIIASLLNNQHPFYTESAWHRFQLYDSMLLNVLKNHRKLAADVFRIMFERHPLPRIWRFLDEKSNFWEELQIMASMPPLPFLQALPQVLWR
ncbi:MAG: lycopene cyclase family protein [Microscillaceae bacterium]|jgi:lycopene beta-cyclase|nr:lycopene cyclase family protein [Microscillaceae bacterium]